ncbi:retinoic acid-induced protein 2-like [Corythoichthys intestinalis]|uniref:retinoic acid-induced protein 2-like n=1 Tax=Corythoichthys intestinalis TaxID=161448 RepID=UPI0025A577C4|nr:retinoic acid-induced protein 2-like [Corythoichthys intestinalis]
MEASGELSRSDVTGEAEIPEKEEPGVIPTASEASCVMGLNKGSLAETPGSAAGGDAGAPAGGMALKMATTVLHPVCLGENPLMLPIHLQMAAATGPQLSPIGAAPYLLTGPNQVSLPLVLDPSVIPQNNILCPNPLTFVEQKSATVPPQDANLLSLLQNPAFAAILQDLFPPQTGPVPCQPPGSPFFPSPYSSPLAPLVPPATLLVPYPVVIPLPVPLPIPLPIPVPLTEDSKSNLPKAVCTETKSTQTPRDLDSVPQSTSPQILDLSMRGSCTVEPKQEYLGPQQQDSVLDLSVPAARKQRAPLLGSARSLERSASLDSNILGSLASLEFSRQHKWMVDGGAGGSAALGPVAPNLEIVSTSQTAKVIVSVKDAIPAILCGKIKGLSGVSTKNFSIKHDGTQGTPSQLFGVPQPLPPPPQHGPDASLKKVPGKNRAIKLKKVSSQEIHFLPIKKQRLAALFPRK